MAFCMHCYDDKFFQFDNDFQGENVCGECFDSRRTCRSCSTRYLTRKSYSKRWCDSCASDCYECGTDYCKTDVTVNVDIKSLQRLSISQKDELNDKLTASIIDLNKLNKNSKFSFISSKDALMEEVSEKDFEDISISQFKRYCQSCSDVKQESIPKELESDIESFYVGMNAKFRDYSTSLTKVLKKEEAKREQERLRKIEEEEQRKKELERLRKEATKKINDIISNNISDFEKILSKKTDDKHKLMLKQIDEERLIRLNSSANENYKKPNEKELDTLLSSYWG